MKAEIDASGQLTITPETPTDAYALRCWSQSQQGQPMTKGVLLPDYNAPLPRAEDLKP